ncbi:hypothetical protein [Xenorhabdus khoisanae]|nr:hypothetical protein [Xenorhabdus khoisanae]
MSTKLDRSPLNISISQHMQSPPELETEQPPTKVGGLVINGLKVRIRVG